MIKSGKLLLTAILLATGKHNVILRSLCPAIAQYTANAIRTSIANK